jgi:hypothetical protein
MSTLNVKIPLSKVEKNQLNRENRKMRNEKHRKARTIEQKQNADCHNFLRKDQFRRKQIRKLIYPVLFNKFNKFNILHMNYKIIDIYEDFFWATYPTPHWCRLRKDLVENPPKYILKKICESRLNCKIIMKLFKIYSHEFYCYEWTILYLQKIHESILTETLFAKVLRILGRYIMDF